MAKFLGLWRFNPSAPWPTDPTQAAAMYEMLFAAMDKMHETGEITEFGFFPDATSGYAISSSDLKTQFGHSVSFYPFIDIEVHEIVPYDAGKEVVRGVVKAQAAAMEAMKR
ncbi:MAG: hypothetical protein ACXV5H_07270 [Halobacteriota archaeon]